MPLCPAYLYRKRPLHIVTELDDRLTHEIKGKLFFFLNNYQSVARENEGLFSRNVALTKETLQHKTDAEDARRERDKFEAQAADALARCEAAELELDLLRRRLSKAERDDEVRRKKEAARALQLKTESYSKTFLKGLQVSTEPEEKQRGGDVDATPTSPYALTSPASPRSPALSAALSPSVRGRTPLASHTLPGLQASPRHGPYEAPATPSKARQAMRGPRPRLVTSDSGDEGPASPAARLRSPYASPLPPEQQGGKSGAGGGNGGTLPSIMSPTRSSAQRNTGT